MKAYAMVCCTLIAALFGLIIRPFAMPRASALAWRPLPAPHPGSLALRMRSFGYAFAGLRFVTRNEANMRIHIVMAATAATLGMVAGIDAEDWRWLALAITMVLAAEVFNTAIEQACNAVGSEYNRAIGAAKDAAAGAVLLSAACALIIGATIFAPHAAHLLGSKTTLPAPMMCGSVDGRWLRP